MSATKIRQARLGDAEALVALYDELAGDADAGAGDAATITPALEAILSDPDRRLLVGEIGGEVLGTVDVLVAENLTHRAKPWAVVENVVVAARARRSGLGAALMEAAAVFARARGCYKVMLLSGLDRTGAHAFYDALGYRAVGKGYKLYLQ
jgi:GNAT superfamily N-acetyltransferase